MKRETERDGGAPDAQRLDFGVLADFAAARAGVADETWALLEEDYEPALERELESRFAVANGFIGMRGSLDVPSEASLPRTYVAGLYAHRPGPPPLSAQVPAPNAFPIRLTVDGVRLDISQGEVRQHARLLHYREGSLRSLWRQQLPDGREVGLESVRFAAMDTRQVAAQLLRLRFDRASEVEFALEEGADSASLTPLADTPQVWVAGGGHRFVACLRVLQVAIDGRPASDWIDATGLPVSFACQRELSLVLLTAYGLGEEAERVRMAAASALSEARASTFPALLARHGGLWESRWQASDIVVEGDEEAQKALRFAVFHLNGAARPGDAAVSIAARGLTGDGYLGHVFWDTEAFILPFFTFTWPEVARSLLEYRVRTLPAARAKAQRLGFRGAFYAWESTDTGEESTPPYALGPHGEVIAIRNGDLEKHVSAAIPYAIWRYWLATHDEDFLLRGGAEVMLETARFWASCARLEPDGQFHICHVIGPDEYHEDVDDNAYTNYMARWTIERAIDTARLLSQRHPPEWRDLAAKTGLTDQELADWERVASALYLPFDARTGLVEQFAGYFDLEDIDLAAYAGRTAAMDVLLGPERTRRSQVIKQADVVMLLALLPDLLPEDARVANFDYYEARCGHGSSLSPPIHSLVAARLGRLSDAERYFRETAAIDLSDSMGNSAAGLHMAALGGLWQAAVFGFGGLTLLERGLAFEPRLPEKWTRLRFSVLWRGRQLGFDARPDLGRCEIFLERGRQCEVLAAGTWRKLRPRQLIVLPLGREGRT